MAIQNQNIATLVCANCQAVNRFPAQRLGDSPVCGQCKQELLPDQPINLTDATFHRFISYDKAVDALDQLDIFDEHEQQ